MANIESKGKKWFYTELVREHFFNPRNILKTDAEAQEYEKTADGVGEVGSPACGDVMKLWIKVDKADDKIVDCRWQTFGCASAIASTSMLSQMVKEGGGMPVNEAAKLTPQDIAKRLIELPPRKFHCSVLGHKALKAALNDYFRKSGQFDRIMITEGRLVDPKTKTTDKDIEKAVLEGAKTLEEVQQKLKVGIGNPELAEKVRALIKSFRQRHFEDEN